MPTHSQTLGVSSHPSNGGPAHDVDRDVAHRLRRLETEIGKGALGSRSFELVLDGVGIRRRSVDRGHLSRIGTPRDKGNDLARIDLYFEVEHCADVGGQANSLLDGAIGRFAARRSGA